MPSNYISITGSPAEIIAAAQVLRTKADEAAGKLETVLAEIVRMSTDKTLGADKFATAFRKSVYHKQTAIGGGGHMEADDAARRSVQGLPTLLVHHADAVTTTITDYLSVDGRNAGAIQTSGVTDDA